MAQSVIGALRVTLGLDSAQFQTGAKKVEGTAQRLGASMQKVGAALSVVGAGIAAAVRSQLNAADEAGKAAARIGLPVEALTRLRFAADLSGVSAAELETAVVRMSRQMVESAADFQAIGVAVRDANGEMRPTVDVLADLSDVFARMPDGAEKTALAVDLLGRSGASMIPLLNGGSAALRAMMQEADDLGVTISEETFRAAEVFNDSITRIQTAATALVRQITAELAPTMARIAETIAQASASFAQLSPEVRTFAAVASSALVVLGPLALAIGTVIRSLAALRLAMIAFTGPAGIAFALMAAGAAAFVTFRKGAEEAPPPIEQARTALALLNETMGTFTSTSAPQAKASALQAAAGYREQAFAALAAAEAQIALREANLQGVDREALRGAQGEMIGGETNPMVGALRAYEFARAELDSLKESVRLATADVRRLANEFTGGGGLAEAMAEGTAETVSLELGLDGVDDVLARLAGAGGGGGGGSVPDLTAALGEIPSTMSAVEQSARQVQDTFASTFAEIVTQASSVSEALSGLARSFANMLAQSAGRSLFSGIARGIGIPGFATGTPFAPGGLAMVGERGPELVNLPRGSRVFNAAETGRMTGGGVTVNNVINIDATGAVEGVAAQVRREIAGFLPDLQRTAIAAVRDAQRRAY